MQTVLVSRFPIPALDQESANTFWHDPKICFTTFATGRHVYTLFEIVNLLPGTYIHTF